MEDDKSVVHVGDWKFGDGIFIEDHISDITKLRRRISSTDLQIVLRERYEQAHGIYDHKSSEDPLALVLMHWSEDPISSSTLRDRFKAFLESRVGDRLKISFPEFLDMPTFMCDYFLELLATSKDEPDYSNVAAMLEGMGKGKT